MAKHAKRHRSDLEGWDQKKAFSLGDAVAKVKAFKDVKFDQTIEVCLHLGIDPKQVDQMIRGAVSLPHGIGKTRRVIAFCGDDLTATAKEAGAIEAGNAELIKQIEGGWMDFDVAVASPDIMRLVSKLGRTLGPRGLMPSPKNGTVTPNIAQAVKEFTAGKVEFRNDSGGNIHVVIGKKSLPNEKLTENAQALIDTIVKMKPSASKGQYLKKVSLSGTMTPSVLVEA